MMMKKSNIAIALGILTPMFLKAQGSFAKRKIREASDARIKKLLKLPEENRVWELSCNDTQIEAKWTEPGGEESTEPLFRFAKNIILYTDKKSYKKGLEPTTNTFDGEEFMQDAIFIDVQSPFLLSLKQTNIKIDENKQNFGEDSSEFWVVFGTDGNALEIEVGSENFESFQKLLMQDPAFQQQESTTVWQTYMLYLRSKAFGTNDEKDWFNKSVFENMFWQSFKIPKSGFFMKKIKSVAWQYSYTSLYPSVGLAKEGQRPRSEILYSDRPFFYSIRPSNIIRIFEDFADKTSYDNYGNRMVLPIDKCEFLYGFYQEYVEGKKECSCSSQKKKS